MKLKQNNCDLMIIPGSMTRRLQPLDLSINKPCKDYVRKMVRILVAFGKPPFNSFCKSQDGNNFKNYRMDICCIGKKIPMRL